MEIGKYELEVLIRESERLRAVKRLIERTKYVNTDDIKAVLDIEEVRPTEGEPNAVQN